VMVKAKKSLGQHFLKDPLVISRIIEALDPQPDEAILEIGSGQGALTGPLLDSGADIISVELDRWLVPGLAKRFGNLPNFRLLENDILAIDPADQKLDNFAVVGNLPYNITTPVMDWLLKYHPRINRAILMMQEEVAERVTSPPGRRARSTISVLTELYYDSEIVYRVSPDAFRPPPKVESAVVKFLRHNRVYVIDDIQKFEKFVRFCFAGKRKNLLNNLNSAYPIRRNELSEIITSICGTPQIRAEQMELETFIRLANEIFSRL
jgi:16S rRNA (adenine1518-N6/adenine1519-N6)-dimethyltransferase